MIPNNEQYEVFDECYGEVTGHNNAGAFLLLDNGQEAFSYNYANLQRGSIVLCSVLKLPTDTKKTLVKIGSVVHYAPLAA